MSVSPRRHMDCTQPSMESRMPDKVVGFNLARAMQEMALDVDLMAASLGVEPQHLRDCLRGRERLHPNEMVAAAYILGVRLTTFFDGELVTAGSIH